MYIYKYKRWNLFYFNFYSFFFSQFLPDTGPLFNVRTPTNSDVLRLETGFIQGDEISVHYDPMISKLIVHGEDRNDALRRFRRALEEYQVVGLTTNIDFIKTVAEHPEFIKGEVETGFIQVINIIFIMK